MKKNFFNYIIRDGLSQKTISRYCPFKSLALFYGEFLFSYVRNTDSSIKKKSVKYYSLAEAEITNCGSGSSSGSFLFTNDLKKFYRKNHGC
jgi:hypothetical protein